MTTADATELVARMMRWWPQAADRLRDPQVVATYAEQLSDVRLEHAVAAADAWSRDGREWPPSAGQVRGKLADLALDVPDWWAVKAALVGRAPVPEGAPEMPDSCPYGECDGGGLVVDWEANTTWPCRCRPERQRIARLRRGRHPLVAQFIEAVGDAEFRDLDEDRTAEAQVREKWLAFVADVRRQITYRGVEPAGLPALERVASGGGRRLGLRRFDPRQLLAREAA